MNDLEREQLRKEQKMANSFKFTKMSKKMAFLPALHTRDFLEQKPVTSVDNKTPYIAHRDKEKLMFPDKVFEKSKKFKLNSTYGSYLSTPVGQESDKYDEVMLRYMTKHERGEPKPRRMSNGQTIVADKASLYLPNTNGLWRPNDFLPNLLAVSKPTFDFYDSVKTTRSFTCERNYSTAKWLYNKKSMDLIRPEYSKADIERGKNLKKIQRKHDKQRSNSRKGSNMDNLSSGYNTKTSLPKALG